VVAKSFGFFAKILVVRKKRFTTFKKYNPMKNESTGDLKITSAAFLHEGNIPSLYTCDGENINPPLHVGNLPEGAKTLAIIMEDPDAPNGTFDHWLAWNIPPENPIEENRPAGISGKNGGGKTGYYGPCPPSGIHRYYFYVFALDAHLSLKAGAGKKDLKDAMETHILAKGTLMGHYQKREKRK
jgi:Raf kinase inhibitor-like YbhB/YbcL family protein